MNEESKLCLALVLSDVSLSSSDVSGSSWGGPALAPLKGRSATLSVLWLQQAPPSSQQTHTHTVPLGDREHFSKADVEINVTYGPSLLERSDSRKQSWPHDKRILYEILVLQCELLQTSNEKLNRHSPALLDIIMIFFSLLQLHWLNQIKVRMHPGLLGILFRSHWQAADCSLYHLWVVFSVLAPAQLSVCWVKSHSLWPTGKKTGCFSFNNNAEKPADWWNVRDQVSLSLLLILVICWYLKGNSVDSALEGVEGQRTWGSWGIWRKLKMFNKAVISPTALFQSSDDWHQMWWGDVWLLSCYCFTVSCKNIKTYIIGHKRHM